VKRKKINVDHLLFGLFLLGSLPVFLIHLGDIPYIADEGIRSLVAVEMDLSKNYIAPTINGEFYYKKPPLWNWILLGSYKVFGTYNEWTSRIPTLFFLYLFCLTIYGFFRRHIAERQAVLVALLFLTCGRILFWDSMLALIDICFSWVIFCLFIWIFHYHSSRKWGLMYVGAYILASIGFMLKALPALVFLGFTLLAYQIIQGTWRKLFSWQHGLGILTMIGILGIYLYSYHQINPVENLIPIFFSESTKRTILEHTVWNTIKHIFLFPLEQLYHFLPWSLTLILLFHKKTMTSIRENAFLCFCAIVFLANIWVYWISPKVYPRYLFMLAPLYFGIGVFLYHKHRHHLTAKIVDGLFVFIGIAALLTAWFPIIYDETKHLPGLIPKIIIIECLLGVGLVFLIRKPAWRWFSIVAVLLILRLGFDWIVLPLRSYETDTTTIRTDAQRVARNTIDEDLYIYANDTMRYETSFYITAIRKKILTHKSELSPGDYFLVNPRLYPDMIHNFVPVDSMFVRKPEKISYLIKIPE
jgi:4-amino-4-deoxy-L-arabinose transferase-like glycosyltransferase